MPGKKNRKKIIKELQEGIDELKMEPQAKTISEMPSKKNKKKIIDELKMEHQAKTISEMPSKKNRKKIIKELQKELDELMEEYIKMELRPCRGDADLRQREKDLEMLEEKIRAVEKDLDKYLYIL